MRKNKILILLLTLVIGFALAGCKEETETTTTMSQQEADTMKSLYGDHTGEALEIMCLDKGAGVEWLRDSVRVFNAGTGSEIKMKADESLTSALSSYIDARSGADIYFSFTSQLQWVTWAKQGKIQNLDDMGLIFKDSMELYGVINGERYTMPYCYSPTGFVYNEEYINEIPSNGEFTQGEFPKTWKGLLDMCESVNTKWNKVVLGQKVVPLSWGGSVGDMGYIFEELWGQIDPEGYRAYYGQTTQTVVGQTNKDLLVNDSTIQALDCIIKLLNPQLNAQGQYYPANSFSDSISHSNLMAEQKFLNGLSVFTISGSWFENEMAEQIEEEEIDFYHFAPCPIVNDGSKETIYINSPAEFFMVPTNGKNQNFELAKAFLSFMATEERCQIFQAYSGIPAAVKYNMAPDTLSQFSKEVAEAVDKCENVVALSDQLASLSGALSVHNNAMFQKCATSCDDGELARKLIEDLYKQQYDNWENFFKSLRD